MPLTLPIPDNNKSCQNGYLYIVATPIGNLQDITLRALTILKEVDLIATEDTRKTGLLLKYYEIKNKLISCYEHNERDRIPYFINKLKSGAAIATVSDAGTPCVSDPGYRLVQAALSENIPVVPIPGVSAAITGLSVSGLPTDTFYFNGFISRKKEKRLKQLNFLAELPCTLIFYESPKRIIGLLDLMIDIFQDRPAVLGREMTKKYEEFIRGNLSTLRETLIARPVIKGECTLLVGGHKTDNLVSEATILNKIRAGLESKSGGLGQIAKIISQEYNLPRKQIYNLALKLKTEKNEL